MKELTPKEAIKILHPDTSRDALWKIEYYAGFNAEKARLKAVEDAFGELPSKIDLIKDYEWGTDCSPEGKQQGLTHCFFVTFHSEEDRDAYLIHPAHKEFGKVLGNKASAVTVLDYWTR